MRILFIVFAILTLTSCQEKAFEDKRPLDEIRFVNFAKHLRDTVNASESNKVLRNALLEKGIPALKMYVKDTLGSAFNSWEAKVLDIIDKQSNIEVNVGITLDPTNKSAQKSIVLSSFLDQSGKAIIEGIKAGDQVKISGIFIDKKGFIDIDNYSDYKFSKNVFDNPEFKTKLTSIEKL